MAVGFKVTCRFLERAWGGQLSGQTHHVLPSTAFLRDNQGDGVLEMGALRPTLEPLMAYVLRYASCVSFLRDSNFMLKHVR